MDNTITNVSIDVLKVHPRNTEFFDDISGSEDEEFKNSIKEEGIILEIIVSPDMTIISGHQRIRAAKELGLSTIMVDIRKYEDNDEYSCAVTPQVRQAGNRLSGLTETAYASLLA